MTNVLNDNFSIVYDICRAACRGDTALGRSSVKELAGLIESSAPDDAALLKRLTKKAAKNQAHFVQSDGGSSKATISHVGEDAALTAEKVAAQEAVAIVRDNPDDIGTIIEATRPLEVGTQLYLATPQQPAQPVAQTLALTDEQRHSVDFAAALLEVKGYTGRARYLRSILAAQPVIGGKS